MSSRKETAHLLFFYSGNAGDIADMFLAFAFGVGEQVGIEAVFESFLIFLGDPKFVSYVLTRNSNNRSAKQIKRDISGEIFSKIERKSWMGILAIDKANVCRYTIINGERLPFWIITDSTFN